MKRRAMGVTVSLEDTVFVEASRMMVSSEGNDFDEKLEIAMPSKFQSRDKERSEI
jgi:hypothetical protein